MSRKTRRLRQDQRALEAQRIESIKLRVARGLAKGLSLGERRQLLALAQSAIDRIESVVGSTAPILKALRWELEPLETMILQEDAKQAAAQRAKLGSREPTTVGELRALLASMPAATPIETLPERLQAQAAKVLGLMPAPKKETNARCIDGVTPLGYWLEQKERRQAAQARGQEQGQNPLLDVEANGGLW